MANRNRKRILLVSNRLPFTVYEDGGNLKLQESAGGLASSLKSYIECIKSQFGVKPNILWVGWPGVYISNKQKREELKSKALKEFGAYPIFIPEKDMDKFYHGFCNKVVWPLFHYFPSFVEAKESYWLTYKKINELFAKTVLEVVKPNDIVWIHDYHLMLLPNLLRYHIGNSPIGFFLHIPFPEFETFRLLPKSWRSEILEGILGADLVGFHTLHYSQYFLRCVLRIMGYETTVDKVITKKRIVKVGTFPISIDFNKFFNAINNKNIQKESNKLSKVIGNDTKVMVSIDRLDYTKGILNRLEAYEIFLRDNPQWHKKIVMVLVVVPSRIGVEHYQRTKRLLDEFVGNLNATYGSIDWTPILYQYKFFKFEQLVSLYSISDIALVIPIRDGMNLVAKEYVATRNNKHGVLILSETAGAANELGEAIIVNPNDIEGIANAIKIALEIPVQEQRHRIEVMQSKIKSYDVIKWVNDFMDNLSSIKEEQKELDIKILGKWVNNLIKDFKEARRRLILIDYDGTLVPFYEDPLEARPPESVLLILKNLADNPKNEVVIISGRERMILEKWFGNLNVGLVAEHGVWKKEKHSQWKMIKRLKNDWKEQVLPLLQLFTQRVVSSYVEEKEFCVAWHYRQSDPEIGESFARDLLDILRLATSNLDIQIIQGNKVIEVRNSGVDKGNAVLRWMAKSDYDFVCAMGDDTTDEDMFKVLPDSSYSIKVGLTQSYAKFNLRDFMEATKLLETLVYY